MFHAISWAQFLTVAILLTILWYSLVLFIYYRREIRELFKRPSEKQSPTDKPAISPVTEPQNSKREAPTLMGPVRMPEGLEQVEMENIRFADLDEPKTQQLGLIPDLMEEIREVLAIIEQENGNKHDFFSLMSILREKYPTVHTLPQFETINQYLLEHTPFPLSTAELEQLWK